MKLAEACWELLMLERFEDPILTQIDRNISYMILTDHIIYDMI